MNIVLLLSDTFRYDNLFDRAQMPVRTPNLDAFAERAVSLSHMYTASFPTIPQRTDMTTGRYGWPRYGWQALSKSGRNHLPVLLGECGYVSQLLCDCPHLFKAGFQWGFHAAHVLRGQEGDVYFTRMNHAIANVMPPDKTRSSRHFNGANLPDLHRWTNHDWRREEDRFAPRTAGLAVEWLEENYRHSPFFLWVDFFDPHEPWDPPEYMVQRYDSEYRGVPLIHPNYSRSDEYTAAELRNLRAHYCAESELVDRWVGRVLQKIDDLRLWDDTIVIFTTDHGTSLGEHGRTGKSNIGGRDDRFWPLYPEVAHIPFMIAAPGVEGGRTRDVLSQPVDILPTLLELAGLDATPPDAIQGVSLAAALAGGSSEASRDLAVCAQHSREFGEDGRMLPMSTTPVVYADGWAYVPVGVDGRRELFSLSEDPLAERNVVDTHAATADELHGRFLAWLCQVDAPPALVRAFD